MNKTFLLALLFLIAVTFHTEGRKIQVPKDSGQNIAGYQNSWIKAPVPILFDWPGLCNLYGSIYSSLRIQILCV